MKRDRIWAVISLSLAGLLGQGCKKEEAPFTPPPPTVTVAAAEQKIIRDSEEFTGRTEAVEVVEVRPRVTGHIQEVLFQSGQMVKKGEVLFVIDPRWHQADHDRANAEYERAKARLQTAESEAARSTQLLAVKAISAEEADARTSRLAEAKAALLSAEAARNSTRLDLDFTQVRAAISGKISRALVTPGNHVSGVAGFTTLLTTIVSVDPVYVYSDVDEASLLKLAELMNASNRSGEKTEFPVSMQLGDSGGFPYTGTIESLDNRLDPNTGSILLRTLFPNKDGKIIPGLFARLRVPVSASYNAVLVEERAIGTDQNQKFVLTLSSSNTVDYRQVKLGPSLDGKRVIRSGLKPGERIVVDGLKKVRPGMPVSPQNLTSAIESTVKVETVQSAELP